MRLLFSVVGLLSLLLAGTACGGQQSATAASSKGGGPRIALADTSPSPCPAGRCQLAVTVRNEQGQSIENADVRYDARHTGMGHSPVGASAEHRGGGRYEGAINFSMAGEWNVGVQVRLPGNNTVYSETVQLPVR